MGRVFEVALGDGSKRLALKVWTGGEDAPMTYVSRDEVSDFCARLNARCANALGLRDLYGNCFEMAYDRGSTNERRWGGSEFGLRTGNLYPGLGLSVTNPVASGGSHPLMLGPKLSRP